MNTYDIGTESQFSGTFKDETGALVDPSSVLIRIKSPNGAVGVFSPTRASIGVYTYNVTLDQYGYWYYRFEGTGSLVVAGDNSVFVMNSQTLF